jgi:hypothetical protein
VFVAAEAAMAMLARFGLTIVRDIWASSEGALHENKEGKI